MSRRKLNRELTPAEWAVLHKMHETTRRKAAELRKLKKCAECGSLTTKTSKSGYELWLKTNDKTGYLCASCGWRRDAKKRRDGMKNGTIRKAISNIPVDRKCIKCGGTKTDISIFGVPRWIKVNLIGQFLCSKCYQHSRYEYKYGSKEAGIEMRRELMKRENPMDNPRIRAKLQGRIMDVEFSKKLSKRMKGLEKSKEWRQKIAKTLEGRILPKEHRENVSKGLKESFKGKRIIPTWVRNGNTKGERRIESMLAVNGWKYEKHVVFGGRKEEKFYVADFVVGNVIIESDGPWHHANPLKYKPDAICVHKKRALDIWEYDQKKTEYFISQGYTVLRFWQHQILRKPQWVFREIKTAVERNEKQEVPKIIRLLSLTCEA